MIRIGLVGVPGAGKTVLAESIKTALENLDNQDLLPVKIIDNYVEDLQKEIDLALSWYGTYIGNTHIALRRESLERQAEKEHNAIITCGTLYETSSYTGQYLQGSYEVLAEEEETERYDLILRVEAITRMFACLYVDTMRYDYIFYLPPVKEVTDVRIKDLEKNLQAAFNAFKLAPVTRLMVEGNDLLEITEKRLEIVLEEVLNANTSEK